MTIFPDIAQTAATLTLTSGVGSRLWDSAGNEYIDFASGILVLAAGNSDPRITEAVSNQADQLINCYAHSTPAREELNDALLATTGGDFDSVFYLSTGSEAIDAAMKLSYAVTGRPGVVTFSGAFHGKTASGVSLGGSAAARAAFGNSFGRPIVRAPYPHPYRWELEGDVDDTALILLENQILIEGPELLGALIIEPFLGAGGVVPASHRYLQGVEAIARKYDLLFILDEFQSGLGRGGALWSYQAAGLKPDILVGAKHLGGGLPIAAVMATAELFSQVPAGTMTSTFGGNPLSSAAAVALLRILETDDLVAAGVRQAAAIETRTADWVQKYALVGDVRIAGLSCGVELADPETKKPLTALAGRAQGLAAEHGLVTMPAAGTDANVVRFAPALNIPDSLLAQGLDRLEEVVSQLNQQGS